MADPFTITFGKNPILFVDKPIEKQGIIDAFTNTPIVGQIFLISSIRGSGKTVLMTGLYENIRSLQDEKKMTFFYRAPRIGLGPLSLLEIERKYKEVFSLTDEDAKAMAGLTKGYAFAFQALGFLTCRQSGDYKKALGEYRFYLEEYSYNKIWSELSRKDQEILYGIARAKSNRTKDILLSCGVSSNYFNPYRKRLVDKGTIDNDVRGIIKFVLPLFKELAIDKYEAEMERSP